MTRISQATDLLLGTGLPRHRPNLATFLGPDYADPDERDPAPCPAPMPPLHLSLPPSPRTQHHLQHLSSLALSASPRPAAQQHAPPRPRPVAKVAASSRSSSLPSPPTAWDPPEKPRPPPVALGPGLEGERSVLEDIGWMLSDLTSELDAMLLAETSGTVK